MNYALSLIYSDLGRIDTVLNRTLHIEAPKGAKSILLHSCCAPCSTAIIECLMDNDIEPTIFYYNPNIYPRTEYDLRKRENIRYAQSLDLKFIDADYDHEAWLKETQYMGHEPERGSRCMVCFKIRLAKTAQYTMENGFSLFTTTLASSRWKDLKQITEAGRYAAALFPGVTFWERNWQKDGLTERKNYLTKVYDFYRQRYCGCEFSLRDANRQGELKEGK